MKRLFNKGFTYRFTPYEDNEQIAGIPAHTAKALIYSSQPSRSQVVAESGALATYTATWAAGAKSIDFDVDGIADPDPNAEAVEVHYYIGIRFKADSAEDYQTVILALPMVRALGTGSALSVSIDDCKQQYTELESFASPAEISDQIKIQTEMLRIELAGKGFDWSMLWRPDQLKTVVACMTVAAILFEESMGEGDKFSVIAQRMEKRAGSLLKQIRLDYDDSVLRGSNVRQASARGPIRCMR